MPMGSWAHMCTVLYRGGETLSTHTVRIGHRSVHDAIKTSPPFPPLSENPHLEPRFSDGGGCSMFGVPFGVPFVWVVCADGLAGVA